MQTRNRARQSVVDRGWKFDYDVGPDDSPVAEHVDGAGPVLGHDSLTSRSGDGCCLTLSTGQTQISLAERVYAKLLEEDGIAPLRIVDHLVE